MKAIGRLLAGCTLCALISNANAFGATSVTNAVAVGQMCIGQAGSEAARRRQSDQLLALTRQAMKDGKFEIAEKHLASAEQLNVKYDSLFAKFVDTPAGLRRELAKLRAAAKDSPRRPSSRFSPYDSTRASAPPPAPFGSPSAEAAIAAMTDGSKSKAVDYLRRGRTALSQNDTVGAIGWWQKAVATGAKFQPNEYSPDRLAQELRVAGVEASRLTPPAPAARGGQLRPSSVTRNDLVRLPPPGGSDTSSRQSRFQQGGTSAAAETTPGRSPLLAAEPSQKEQAMRWVAEGMSALDRGDLETARRLALQAEQLGVSDREYSANQTRPWELRLKVDQATRLRGGSAVVPATGHSAVQASGSLTDVPQSYPVRQGIYDPGVDTTRNRMAQAEAAAPAGPVSGIGLYEQGLRALEAQDRERAIDLFRRAWEFQAELDPITRQQLKDKLSLLSAPRTNGGTEPSPFEQVDTRQNVLRQQLLSEIAAQEKAAEEMFRTDPKGAHEILQRLRDRVAEAELEPASRNQLLAIVERRVSDLQRYIDQHRSEIELDERNRAILDNIDRERTLKLEIQDKVGQLIDQFNTLIEEERFEEAEVIVKQVRELDPNSPITRTLMLKSRLMSRVREQESIDSRAEESFFRALQSVDESRIPFDDREPLVFSDARSWGELSRSRREWLEMQHRRLSPTELDIQESLKQKVEVRFTNRPLKDVLDTLGSITGVNIYADAEGMSSEGVSTDTPVTINLTEPIMLKSALHLILEPLRLSYVIQHEVLRVTSEQARDSNVYAQVYNVADLVIPIPNFAPGHNVGLPAALRDAHRSLGYGGMTQPSVMSPLTIASNELEQPASLSSNVLAQTNAYGLLANTGRPTLAPGSPGAAGGAALADFDTLMELITSTVEPDSWDTIGGPGAIEPFPTNLSLVISQTQDVHDQIADLLEQLRRLQDLQVTIEVRFITLQDNWFERIGVDFDFDIDDNVTTLPRDDSGNSVTIGLDNAGNPTADLDLSFQQGSFGLAAPAFGGFQAGNAASFGFAILSDIEAFFLLNAATGDTRSNVLQAPKVTLFNGQLASVSDTSQRPFVTSLIPVVGDFAAAHQPVIVVLSEGTNLNVQAVVSSDRRFVRLTLQPIFSQIGNVETFTFEGTTTTDSGQTVVDGNGDATGDIDNAFTATTGTTVQLPTFSFTSVSTTVSVPDGGTILLGGIKRLQEGRNEHGVPMLSKLPYVNRLFRNVGIGRNSQSLMLMVTPRIIIQEEEEEKLGIVAP